MPAPRHAPAILPMTRESFSSPLPIRACFGLEKGSVVDLRPTCRQTGGGGYGQNLASWSSTTDINSLQIRSGAQAVTNFWYNSEMGLWNNNYGREPSGSLMSSAGHFSQVVWKGTQQVGCATVYCPSGRGTFSMNTWYTVCNYRPAGMSPSSVQLQDLLCRT